MPERGLRTVSAASDADVCRMRDTERGVSIDDFGGVLLPCECIDA